MSLSTETIQEYELIKGEIANFTIDCRSWLDPDELITGTPTLAAGASGVTFSGAAVTASEEEILGQLVPAGKAVTFSGNTTAATAGEYRLLMTASTNSSPAQTRMTRVKVTIIDP
jgi:hypothetical protein